MPSVFEDPEWDRAQLQKRQTWYKDHGVPEPTGLETKTDLASAILQLAAAESLGDNVKNNDQVSRGGALVIFIKRSNPPKVEIQKDKKKRRLGFCYGGVEKNEDPFIAAMREAEEETGVVTKINEGHLVETIVDYSEGVRHEIHIFFVEVPADTKLIPGGEQDIVEWASPELIDRWVQQGNTLNLSHVKAWRIVKDKGLI